MKFIQLLLFLIVNVNVLANEVPNLPALPILNLPKEESSEKTDTDQEVRPDAKLEPNSSFLDTRGHRLPKILDSKDKELKLPDIELPYQIEKKEKDNVNLEVKEEENIDEKKDVSEKEIEKIEKGNEEQLITNEVIDNKTNDVEDKIQDIIEIRNEHIDEKTEKVEKTEKEVISVTEDTLEEDYEFVSNEVFNLLLPYDDVVLGELTEDAIIEQLGYSDYIKLFWKNFYRNKNTVKLDLINKFLKNYNLKFHKHSIGEIDLYPNLSWDNIKNIAFMSVEKNDIETLRIMVNNFSNLLLSKNKDNETLLSRSMDLGHSTITKFLLIKKHNKL